MLDDNDGDVDGDGDRDNDGVYVGKTEVSTTKCRTTDFPCVAHSLSFDAFTYKVHATDGCCPNERDKITCNGSVDMLGIR